MTILTIRTDQPEASIALFQNKQQLASLQWKAHKKLAETIHNQLRQCLDDQGLTVKQIEGIVLYKGPGSFTGLRIGASVANALANALGIPVVGTTGDGWQELGTDRIAAGENDAVVVPEYGSPAHITQQKK